MARGNTSKKDAASVGAAVRDEQALQLRMSGASFQVISDTLGYGGPGNAHRAVKKRILALREACNEAAEDVRQMELGRLDDMLAGLWEKAKGGDVQAIDRVLRIQERRAAYEGLDTPKALKVEVARELSAVMDRLTAGLAPDVLEQVLAVIVGEPGSPAPQQTEGGQAEAESASAPGLHPGDQPEVPEA
jgi:hypothetical protein